jgi:predicted 2-oxoglutarate/Fe(II)-dependent dioxygenase YbiX
MPDAVNAQAQRVPLPGFGEYLPDLSFGSSFSTCFGFTTVGGRYIALSFLGAAGHPASLRVIEDLYRDPYPFNAERACCFIVTQERADVEQGRLKDRPPGIWVLRDYDGENARKCGLMRDGCLHAGTIILDPMMRVVTLIPLTDPDRHAVQIHQTIASLPPILGIGMTGASIPPPILVIPRVFEESFCDRLLAYYDQHGGGDSGLVTAQDGQTVGALDYGMKRRFDCVMKDEELKRAVSHHITRRVAPLIHKAFQFEATRIERYLLSCYDSEVGGYFRPHIDNSTPATAHRRFALSIHLNSGDYEGGEVRFPEFGMQTYCAPRGGAVVFSVSLIHEVTPVTKGRRLIFLTFLYGEDDAAKRQYC